MLKMQPLNDLQLILLSHAAQRDDGSLLPIPGKFGGEAARIEKVIPPLLRRQLIEAAPVTNQSQVWRHDGQQPLGIFLTTAGRSAIAADDGAAAVDDNREVGHALHVPNVAASGLGPVNKTELVLGMLRDPEGATIAELTEATGWLPHTTRAALTGLRKKGHAVERAKRSDVTCYRLAAASL